MADLDLERILAELRRKRDELSRVRFVSDETKDEDAEKRSNESPSDSDDSPVSGA